MKLSHFAAVCLFASSQLLAETPAPAISAQPMTPAATATLTTYPQFMAGDFFARNYMKTIPHPLAFSADKPAGITKEPAYKGAPLYGQTHFGDDQNGPGAWVVLDDEANKIYIDANQNGDLTDDPQVVWDKVTRAADKTVTGYDGFFTFPADSKSGPNKYGIHMYRPKGANRAWWQTVSAPTGPIVLDSKTYVTFLYDQTGTGAYNLKPGKKTLGTIVFVDTDQDGTWRPINHREDAQLGEPIQIGDKWYSFDCSADGHTLTAFPAIAPPTVPSVPMLTVGQTAPDITLVLADGTTSKLSDHKGQVVLLDMWATWCGPCVAAMPKVQALHEKMKDNPKVAVIGLNVMDEKDAFQGWVQKNQSKYTFTFAFDGGKNDDGVSAASKAYGVQAIPTTFVIGPDGKIAEVISGYTEENEAKVVKALNSFGLNAG
jgi:peroxiredoxin